MFSWRHAILCWKRLTLSNKYFIGQPIVGGPDQPCTGGWYVLKKNIFIDLSFMFYFPQFTWRMKQMTLIWWKTSWPIQGVPCLPSEVSWDKLQHTRELCEDKQVRNWMGGCFLFFSLRACFIFSEPNVQMVPLAQSCMQPQSWIHLNWNISTMLNNLTSDNEPSNCMARLVQRIRVFTYWVIGKVKYFCHGNPHLKSKGSNSTPACSFLVLYKTMWK